MATRMNPFRNRQRDFHTYTSKQLLTLALVICITLIIFHLRAQHQGRAVGSSLSTGHKQAFKPLSCASFLTQPLPMPDPNRGTQIIKGTNTKPKFNISLHNKEFDSLRWGIYESGEYYETKLTELIQSTLRKNPTSIFLDVGANIGWFSLLALAEGHEVVAFEPHPLNYLRFCQSIISNGWENKKLSFYPYGVGNVHGDVLTLSTADSLNPGEFSFKHNNIKHGDATAYNINVSIATLDAIAEERQWFEKDDISIAFLKLDVEGFEANALKGAIRLLDSKKIGLIELEYKVEKVKEPRLEEENDPIEILTKHGYCLRMLGDWMGPSVKYDSKVPKVDEDLRANLAAISTENPNLNLVFSCCDCDAK